MALIVPYRYLYPAARPWIVPGNSNLFIRKILWDLGRQIVFPDFRRRLLEKHQWNRERLRHLRRRWLHRSKACRGYHSQDGVKQEPPLVTDEIQCSQNTHLLAGDCQLLLRLSKSAARRGLAWLHPSARKTDLSSLPQVGRPNLVQQVQAIYPFHQRTKDSIALFRSQQARLVVCKAACQCFQSVHHSSIVKAQRQFTASTTGTLAAYSPSKDQGRSSSVSRWMEDTCRNTKPWLSYSWFKIA